MFSKEGKGPEREFFWTARDLSWESWLVSGGRVPETAAELRLIPVTKELVESQLTFFQVQKWADEDQPVGAGEREKRSFDMTAESSAAERRRRVRKERRRRPRWRVAMGC